MSDVTIGKYDGDGVFGVIAEWKTQGPILMESEGDQSGREAAEKRIASILQRPDCLRACVVRLVPISGNELLIHDMQRMQK